MNWWRHFLLRIVRKIWFRAALFSLGGVLLALVSRLLTVAMPEMLAINIGQDSVDSILRILASSMLAVTTFSLTAMVQAYSAATTQGTPRATQLMLADPTSQNALSTFLGGFLFSIVGIIALSTGYYGGQGRTVLFLGTIVVIALIVITLLRWIDHVTGFGRMGDVIDRVEAAATRAMRAHAAAPLLGGQPSRIPAPDAIPVRAAEAGYVTLIDVAKLARLSEAHDLDLHLEALPGTLIHQGRPLLRAEGVVEAATRDALASAFTVEPHRTFEQDPRLGVIALAEIASRALSPAVNDPGTAIEVLNATRRVFMALLDPETSDPPKPSPRLFVPGIPLRDMVISTYRPIARDGAGVIEVQIRLQKTLASLAESASDPGVFRVMADDCAERARPMLPHASDRDALTLTRRELGFEG
ncbi:DUF2254 domain-containing protein [Amaricoccus solimangrovi]|uniref:DUF2254 domain-containing protein n=1 Tax=Amaricoccus solimangrovi TaxID=2589815 RepID=A0A501WWP6_9RHOB|nr:DUF2254 domain-containing protein [Amaricoccus solimangrovi]TPE52564.1 DUF2254 domain-containing protein [Amaricoccus solimangrovi]